MSGTVWRAPAHCPGPCLPQERPVHILGESNQLCLHVNRIRRHRCVERPKKNHTTIPIGHCLSTFEGCDLVLVINKRRELIKVPMEVSAIIRETCPSLPRDRLFLRKGQCLVARSAKARDWKPG